MKKLLLFSALVGFLGALGYFSYSVIHDRYFSESPNTVSEKRFSVPEKKFNDVLSPINDTNQDDPSSSSIPEETVAESLKNTPSSTEKSDNIKASITRQHCNDDCKAFATDLALFEYCEQVCGISPAKNEIADCEKRSDLEKDYCQKDLAISKMDAKLCDSISDDNLRKTCKNRIAEDTVEKMQPSATAE